MSNLVDLKRYALVYVATMLGLMVGNVVLGAVFDYSLPSGLSTILPAMAGAMVEGQKRAQAGGAPFSGPQAWAAARNMTLAVTAITAAVVGIMFLIPAMRGLLSQVPLPLFATLILALLGATLLINRFSLTFGYNNQRKAQERRAGK